MHIQSSFGGLKLRDKLELGPSACRPYELSARGAGALADERRSVLFLILAIAVGLIDEYLY